MHILYLPHTIAFQCMIRTGKSTLYIQKAKSLWGLLFSLNFFCGKCAQFMTTRFFDNHQSPKNLVWKGYFCWEFTISVYICNTVFFLKFMTTLFIIQKSGFEFFYLKWPPSPPLWRISENSTNFGSAGFPYKPLGLGVSNFWRQMYPTDRSGTLAHSSTECKCG